MSDKRRFNSVEEYNRWKEAAMRGSAEGPRPAASAHVTGDIVEDRGEPQPVMLLKAFATGVLAIALSTIVLTLAERALVPVLASSGTVVALAANWGLRFASVGAVSAGVSWLPWSRAGKWACLIAHAFPTMSAVLRGRPDDGGTTALAISGVAAVLVLGVAFAGGRWGDERRNPK